MVSIFSGCVDRHIHTNTRTQRERETMTDEKQYLFRWQADKK